LKVRDGGDFLKFSCGRDPFLGARSSRGAVLSAAFDALSAAFDALMVFTSLSKGGVRLALSDTG